MFDKTSISHLSRLGKRHQKNDDYVIANPELGLFIVCDGVSQGDHGHLASRLIATHIENTFMKLRDPLFFEEAIDKVAPLIRRHLEHACIAAHQELLAEKTRRKLEICATTCEVALLHKGYLFLAHTGDSRSYLIRGKKLKQITQDHTVYQELVKQGNEVDVKLRNQTKSVLTRAIGDERFVKPDIFQIELQKDDVFFSCTDGIHGFVDAKQLEEILILPERTFALEKLIDVAQVRGSGDDCSLVIAEAKAASATTAPALDAAAKLSLIESNHLFQHLDFGQLTEVASACRVAVYAKGSVIVQENTKGSDLYMIGEGTVDVVQGTQTIAKRGKFDFFGEISLIKSQKRSASIIATTEAKCLILSKSELRELFLKDPDLERYFYRGMLEGVVEKLAERES